MKVPGWTAEETTALGHIVGLVGAALTILWCIVSAIIAFAHNLNRAPTSPAALGWEPPAILIGLCIGLIVGAAINDFYNTPKPGGS